MAKVKASAMCICHYISWQSWIVILPLPPCMTLLCPRTRLQKKHLIIFVNMASLLDTAVCVHARMNEWNIIAQVMFRLVKTWVKTVIFSFLARRKWFRSCLAWIQYVCAASQTATKNHKVFLITSLLFWTSPGAQVGKEKCVYSTDDDERLDWQKKKKSAKARQFETADKVSVFLPNSFPVCMGVTAGPMLWTDLDYHHIGLAVLKQTMSRE